MVSGQILFFKITGLYKPTAYKLVMAIVMHPGRGTDQRAAILRWKKKLFPSG
jgi:hypothetical protein